MRRFRIPDRPNPARVQANRIAAARVATASVQQAAETAIVELGVPADLQDKLDALDARLDEVEAALP